jgi:hypothetical protein
MDSVPRPTPSLRTRASSLLRQVARHRKVASLIALVGVIGILSLQWGGSQGAGCSLIAPQGARGRRGHHRSGSHAKSACVLPHGSDGLTRCGRENTGGGPDPWLLALPARLQADYGGALADPAATHEPLNRERVEAALAEAGLCPHAWSFRLRLSQAAYRDWLKIPVLTNRLLAGLDARQRVRAISAAYRQCAPGSWRWEEWSGWTASKAGA